MPCYNPGQVMSVSYLSAIIAAFVILSCPPGDFPEGLSYFEGSSREAKVYCGGNEFIGGMPVGSILYIFDRETDKFIGLRMKVRFDDRISETHIQEGRFRPGPGFWNVTGPYKDAPKYFGAVREFFTKQFVMPPALDYIDNNSAAAAWYSVGEGFDAEVTLRTVDGVLTLEAGVTQNRH